MAPSAAMLGVIDPSGDLCGPAIRSSKMRPDLGRRRSMMATVSYAHIEHNAEGEPIIAQTRIKVRMIALDRLVHGWDAEEIQQHHPDLTPGQVHSALAYYFDHKEELDRTIADRHEKVGALRAAPGKSPGRRKLRKRGLLPCRREGGHAS